MAISSIDDLLMGGGGNSLQPDAPENQYQDEPEPIQELEHDAPEYDDNNDSSQDLSDDNEHDEQDDDPYGDDDQEEKPRKQEPKEFDEYGNEKAKPRMYTEAEHKELVSKAIRERFERFERNNPDIKPAITQQQLQNKTAGFEFNPDSEQSLPQQLESFIEQTVSNMTSKREHQAQQMREQEIHAEFEEKLSSGMQKFGDFRDVINSLPFKIDDPMTLATRAMENPAAFLYAAAKRHPQELERISKLRDPYAKMTEMGRLEERMRKNRPTTKAPRPLGRTPADAHTATPKKKTESNGDDLLARADAKRLATVKTRLRGNR